MQAPRDVVNRVLDPVNGHEQIPAHVGCSSRFATELVVKRARLRVVLEKHVQALERRELFVPSARRVVFVERIH